jgi:transcriptional regulator with XRE-family HTH domain
MARSCKLNVRALRRRAKLNQAAFWARVGVTQPGGSRYEQSGHVPKPVRILLALAYPKSAEQYDATLAALNPLTPGRGKHGD